MKQVWIPRIGEPEVLELREAPDPEPGAGEVRIRIRASGINFADILARMGLYPDAPKLPAVVGYEVAGVVDATGEGVSGFARGDRVLATTHFGGYSDVVCVPRDSIFQIPEGLGFEAAAAIPVNYLTAWLMLVSMGNIRRGETVLVHACAGGVGLAALQICRHFGAEVIGTASASKHPRLRDLGVAACIDYRTQDFEVEVAKLTDGRGVDIALDAIGGESFAKSYRSLASLGRLFIFGSSSVAPGSKRSMITALLQLWRMPTFKPMKLMSHNRGVIGVNLGHLWSRREELTRVMSEILTLVDDGSLAPVVDRSFPLADASSAHRYIQDRKNFGKVILVP